MTTFPGPSQSSLPDLRNVPTETLFSQLSQSLTITANALRDMSFIWRELEARGEDLSGLRNGLTVYLPLIADARLLPDVVVQYAGNRKLLEALARLSLEDQKHLLATGRIEVYLPNSGMTTQRTIADMTTPEINQVFDNERVRTPDEQHQYFEAQIAQQPETKSTPSSDNPGLRFRYGALEFGGARIQKTDGKPVRADELLEALSQHYGVDLASIVGKR